MASERSQERARPLSQGFFGAPASQAERDRAARAAEKRLRTGQGASNRDG